MVGRPVVAVPHGRDAPLVVVVVWPSATTPLTGPVLDAVVLGVDEDANVLWAVELRADRQDLALSAESVAALEETRRSGTSWPEAPTAAPCCGASVAASRCSARPSRTCASTSCASRPPSDRSAPASF
jgi:hypothetical protein